jgi:hypothetical protein
MDQTNGWTKKSLKFSLLLLGIDLGVNIQGATLHCFRIRLYIALDKIYSNSYKHMLYISPNGRNPSLFTKLVRGRRTKQMDGRNKKNLKFYLFIIKSIDID